MSEIEILREMVDRDRGVVVLHWDMSGEDRRDRRCREAAP